MKKLILAAIFFSFLLPEMASAHAGRTDASGCHKDKKTGERHCHNKAKPASK